MTPGGRTFREKIWYLCSILLIGIHAADLIRVNRKLKPRILSIDDDPGIGALLLRLFHGTGRYTVALESEPFQAVETARKFRPDIIILDVNMPGQNGIEIAGRLRAEPWLRYRPILLFTGMPTPLAMQRLALGDGPVDYLHKGTSLDAIIEAADRLLAGQN